MKRILMMTAFAGIVLFGCTLNGAGTDPSNMNISIRENDGGSAASPRAVVEQFSIGSPRQDVFYTLGIPDRIFYGTIIYTPGVDYDADAYHIYDDVGLSFCILGDTVAEITLLSDDWIASNGLVVGMSRDEMIAILGEDFGYVEDIFRDFYLYPQYDITVEVYRSDQSVGEINIKEGNVG